MASLLSVHDLTVSYGNIQAVKGISFDVREGEIVTLIGANGAGKSSTLRAISGLVPYSGQHHSTRAKTCASIAGRSDRGAGHRPGAGRPRHLRQSDRAWKT